MFFMVSLAISGLTAVPVQQQLTFLLSHAPQDSAITFWLQKVLNGYLYTQAYHPYLLYGYDWLAFAHVVLAILFIGPYRQPVRNIWVVQFGMIACVLVFPTAFIAGSFRGIPLGWQLIDCSFGIVGLMVLWPCYRTIKILSDSKKFKPAI